MTEPTQPLPRNVAGRLQRLRERRAAAAAERAAFEANRHVGLRARHAAKLARVAAAAEGHQEEVPTPDHTAPPVHGHREDEAA